MAIEYDLATYFKRLRIKSSSETYLKTNFSKKDFHLK